MRIIGSAHTCNTPSVDLISLWSVLFETRLSVHIGGVVHLGFSFVLQLYGESVWKELSRLDTYSLIASNSYFCLFHRIYRKML